MDALDETDRAVLDLESSWWRYAEAKEVAVAEVLGWSVGRYHQELNALIDRPEALAHAPQLVRRLRRLRTLRTAARSAARVPRQR